MDSPLRFANYLPLKEEVSFLSSLMLGGLLMRPLLTAHREERVKMLTKLASLFKMDDATWAAHANPWSVYTRYATLPAYVAVIYFRSQVGALF